MTPCTPPITIEELVNRIASNRDFDYVSYRLYLGAEKDYTLDSESIFAGCFAISRINGLHIISLDGDTYSVNHSDTEYQSFLLH